MDDPEILRIAKAIAILPFRRFEGGCIARGDFVRGNGQNSFRLLRQPFRNI